MTNYKKTQEEKAEELGLTPSFLCLLLSGKRNLRYPDAARVARILDCEPTIWVDGGGGTPGQRREAIENL